MRSLCLLVLLFACLIFSARAEEGPAPEGSLPSSDAVATFDAVSGLVEVQRDGEWLEAGEGDEVALDDIVRTGADSLARLRFLDADPESGAEATLVDLGPDAELQIEQLEVRSDQGAPQRTGLLGVLRGAVQAITKGWSNGSMFSVRAGTTVCGIRGSIANVGYDPSDETTTITSLDGEMYTFPADNPEEAFRRTREAAQNLGRGRRAQYLRHLQVGEKGVRAGRGALRFGRLKGDVLKRARAAANGSRQRGAQNSRGWIGAFARVKAPAQRRGKMSRRRLGRRAMLRQGARRPMFLKKGMKNRIQQNDRKRPVASPLARQRNLQKSRNLKQRMKRMRKLRNRRKGAQKKGVLNNGGLNRK